MTTSEFRALLERMASARAAHDTEAAAALFAPDVRYVDPMRYSLDGRAAVQSLFEEAASAPPRLTWHNILFDETRQIGVAEYSSSALSQHDHGVALIELTEAGLIARWREFQHRSDFGWAEFWGEAAFRS